MSWTRHIGSTEDDRVLAVAVDSVGSVYAAGVTGGTLPRNVASGLTDVLVAKYDPSGTLLWAQQFGSDQNDQARGIVVDKEGDIYLAGHSTGALDGGPGRPEEPDSFVAKYSPDGDRIWLQQFDVPGMDSADAIAAGSEGGVYVAGVAWGDIETGASGTVDHPYLAKFDEDGARAWVVGGPLNGLRAAGVASDDEGHVYIGTYSGESIFVAKYDDAGSEMWTQSREMPISQVTGVSVDRSDSSVIVVGWTTHSEFGDDASTGGTDAFAMKFNSAGKEEWARLFGTTAEDYAYGVAVDNMGLVHVVGRTAGSLNRGSLIGYIDAFVATLSDAGEDGATRQFGSAFNDQGTGIAVSGDGSVYVTGWTDGQWDDNLSTGGGDGFVVHLCDT